MTDTELFKKCLAMLDELQTQARYEESVCPACGREKRWTAKHPSPPQEHAPDCDLSALMKELAERVKEP